MPWARLSPRTGVWLLAVAETLAYACFFYIFAALILALEADLGWDRATLALGPTLAIVLSACLAPLAGRIVDAGRGPEMMAAGALIGAGGLLILAQSATHAGYYAAWAALGFAQVACLYETCFAFLVRRLGTSARAAITRVTLVAGFASTIAFPAAALLNGVIGWRGTVLVAMGVAMLILAPLFWFGGQALRQGERAEAKGAESEKGALAEAMRRGVFWMMALLFALISLNHWVLITFALPIFTTQGASEALAVLAASFVGPAQVAGRLWLMRYEARIGTGPASIGSLVIMGIGTLCLWLAGLAPMLIFAFALLQGATMGVITILRPVLIGDVLGRRGYGAIAGAVQMPGILAGAAAPIVGAVILDGIGVGGMIALSILLTLGAVLLMLAVLKAA